MAVNKIDPKVIFASEAPAHDTPAVFTNRTVGWGETRKNGGRPTIKQMNAEQQSTDLKILWLNENSVTPFDSTIDYPTNAVTVKDGVFKIFDGSVWEVFLDKTDIGLGNVDNTSDLNKPISTATQTALDLKADKVFIDNTLLLQQEINDRGGATWYTKSGGYALNDRVILDNGDIVRSTVANNIIDPNVDMVGWVKSTEIVLNTVSDVSQFPPQFNKQVISVLSNNASILEIGAVKYAHFEFSTEVPDGVSIISAPNGGRWKICNKNSLNILNFGATAFNNEIPEKVCDYFISNSNLVKYFEFCERNKLKAKFPAGLTALESGNYIVPSAGIVGEGKESTVLVVPKNQTGLLFKYNTIGVYSAGRGEPLEKLVITNVDRSQVDIIEINTPSRGCVLRDVNIYSDGKCVILDDAYYLNFDNCGIFGTFRSNFENITLESDKFTGVGVYTKPDREINNILFHKCDFKDLKQAVKGQGDSFRGSNTILFTNTAIERIGDTVFDIRGWNTTFLTAYVEFIDLHKNFKTGATSEDDLTLLIRGGAGVTSFLGQNIVNLSNVRATNPDVCVFNTVIDSVQFDVASFNMPSGWIGRMQHYKTYSSMPAIVFGGVTPIPVLGYVNPSRHITQKDTNQFRSITTQPQSSHAFVNVQKMGTNYRFLKLETAVQFSSNNAKPLGGVDGRIADIPILVSIKGRQYRVGTGDRTEFIEIDGVFRINKDAPDYAEKVYLLVDLKGTSSKASSDSFFNATLGSSIATRLKMWRLTPARTDLITDYNFAYQIGLTGESTGNAAGHNIINDIEIQILSPNFTNGQAQTLGIYEQGGNFVASPVF